MSKVKFSSVETIQIPSRSKLAVRTSMTVDQYESQRKKSRQRHSGGPSRSRSSRRQKSVSQRLRAKAAAISPRDTESATTTALIGKNRTDAQRKTKRNLKAALLQSRFASKEFVGAKKAPSQQSRSHGSSQKNSVQAVPTPESARCDKTFGLDDEEDVIASDTSSETLSSTDSFSTNGSAVSSGFSIELELAQETTMSSRHRFIRAMDAITRRPGSFTHAASRRFRARAKKRWHQAKIHVDEPTDHVPRLGTQDSSRVDETEVALITPHLKQLRLTSIDGNEPDEEDHAVTDNETTRVLNLLIPREMVDPEGFVGVIHHSLSSMNCGIIATAWMTAHFNECIGTNASVADGVPLEPVGETLTKESGNFGG